MVHKNFKAYLDISVYTLQLDGISATFENGRILKKIVTTYFSV